MRWTEFFIPTIKETPHDATVASHALMLRAGLIRQLAAGIYTYLPLGYRALRKVEKIVREEMNRAGAIELHMPVLHPLELWQQTGRTESMGDTLLRLAGPAGDWRSQTVLGPTHEEPITEIARAYLTSYKMLPINLYQIQVKFRGEARPKSGVLRTREFLMKDAYSFHRDKPSLDEGYQKMYDAYCRIFSRCGLPYIVCEAESGPIGGDASHEFMVVTEAGEDMIVRCTTCGYAANTERAATEQLPQDVAAMQPLQEVHTPGQRTIDEVTAFLGTNAARMIKTLIYEGTQGLGRGASTDDPNRDREGAASEPSRDREGAVFAGEQRPLFVVLVRGDHEVNENKLSRVAGCKLQLAGPALIERLTGAPVGFAGPHTLDKSGVSYRLIVDQAVAVMRNGISGANRADYHVTGVNPRRDFPLENKPSGPTQVTLADVRSVTSGDRCSRCGGELHFDKCIEVGHVFKLGSKYSDALEAKFVDADGTSKSFIMGCYGIGLNRIMAAAIEASHDDAGIRWPATIAPFSVHLCSLDVRDEKVMAVATQIHDALEAAGLDTLFDDRDARPGPKFADADLIGIPVRVTVGKKGLEQGSVEIKLRGGDQVQKLSPVDAVSEVERWIATQKPNRP